VLQYIGFRKYAVTALLFLFAAGRQRPAQDWPGKTVRIVVPFGAGSTPDIVARLVAEWPAA
jgi:tripartite-type tricarboxylate transporter receptor subunit TctC